MRSVRVFLWGLVCAHILALPAAQAQGNSYKQTNLVSDTQGPALHKDTNLINPWGIAFFPGNPFWVADNNSGFSTLYDKTGMVRSNPFTIPPPLGSSNPATPTGIVANIAQTGFNVNGHPSLFIFATEDGTISGWNGNDPVTLKIDNARAGAVYKGLALVTNTDGTFLLVADFNCGCVAIFDALFNARVLTGTFTDPTLPAGYAPFGIHVINNQVLITYALQDQPKHDPVRQAGAGYVSLFDLNGVFIRRVASQGMLNAPWGAVIPPASFGAFGGKLLIGNFGDGTINAYDINQASGFLGQMKDANGAVVTNASLWDLVFDPSGGTGDPNTMYITAGLANEKDGLFSAITANAAPPAPAPDFSISAMPAAMTISAGQSAAFTVTLGGLNGFNSAVTLACSGQPLGSTCNFSSPSLSPASGGTVSSTMTVMTSSSPYHPATVMAKNSTGGILAALLPISTFGFFGLLVASPKSRERFRGRKWFHCLAASFALLIVAGMLLAAGGCGYNANSAGNGTQRGTTTLMITGTSGNLSHSTSVSLTVQ
jgi:uncharacterized protein (TIGR03118 family)